MKKKHPEGYWANQLSDEQIQHLAIKLSSKNEKFKKIDYIQRKDSQVVVKFYYEKTNTYLRCKDATITINDFSLTGKIHSDFKFYQFMIDSLGNEYADDLINYLEKTIQNMNEDLRSVKSLIKLKNDLEDNLQQNENTL